jgi:hypothetical protein
LARLLPYFVPPYKAIHRHCQLCNAEVAQDQYETHDVRHYDADNGAAYVFCTRCAPIVGDIAELVESERARLTVEFNKEVEHKLEALVRQALAEKTGTRVGEQRSSSPSGNNESARTSQARRRGTFIGPNKDAAVA